MATENALITMHGISLPKAYYRLQNLQTNRTSVEINFNIYCDKQSYDDGKPRIDRVFFTLTGEDFDTWFGIDVLDGDTNPIKQAYLYLHSLEGFEEAKQV